MPSRTDSCPRFRRLQPEERRQELVEATLDCLSRLGPQGTGVREICRRVGVSPGLLNHYFDSKADLILEALRTLTREFYDKMRGALAEGGGSPEQRLRSSFRIYFSSGEVGAERTGAYLAFWTLARTDPAVRRIQRSTYRRQQRLFESVLKELAEDRDVRIDAHKAAIGLVSLLDGLWLEICLDPAAFSSATAASMSWSLLDAFVQGGPRRRRSRADTSGK
jgi:TetR/AcrR family transcriptional repressor of bet genes